MNVKNDRSCVGREKRETKQINNFDGFPTPTKCIRFFVFYQFCVSPLWVVVLINDFDDFNMSQLKDY